MTNIEKNKLAELVKQLQQGDGKAFEEIYNMTVSNARFTALKFVKNNEDIEDILQDAYMKVLDKINDLDKPESFISWFNKIVANTAKNLLRKKKPALYEDFSAEDDEGSYSSFEDIIKDDTEEFIPEVDVEKDEVRQKIMELVDGLSDARRTAIVLYYFNEMTTKEIAEALDTNENTIKSRLFQAKKELAQGVKDLEKKGFKFFGVAPISIVIWALRASSVKTATAYVSSGAAAATFTAITSASTAGAGTAVTGTAAATVTTATTGTTVATATATATASVATTATTAGGIAAKIAGFTIAQKVVAGVATAAVVAGTATGTATVVKNHNEKIKAETTTTAYVEEVTEISTENYSVSFIYEEISTEPESSEEAEEIISETERTSKTHVTKETEKTTLENIEETKPTESKTRFTTVRSSSVSQSTKPRTTTTKAETTKKPTTEKATVNPIVNRTTTTTTKKSTTTSTATTTTKPTTTESTTEPTTLADPKLIITFNPSGTKISININPGDYITNDFICSKIVEYDSTIDPDSLLVEANSPNITAQAGEEYAYSVQYQ